MTPISLRLATLVAACGLILATGAARAADAASAPASEAEAPRLAGLDKNGMDTAVRPQDDLYTATNGAWLKSTEIPGDKPQFGTFTVLRDLSDQRVRRIVEDLTTTRQAPGTIAAKIADFYGSYLDLDAIDKAGLGPLKPYLSQIDAVKDQRGLQRLMGEWEGLVDLPLGLAAMPDFRNPGVYAPQTWQGGLGMPDRDYYLKPDARFAKVRSAYTTYAARLLALAGDAKAGAHAAAVAALEKQLATAQWDQVHNRDPAKLYNPMTLAHLATTAPGLDWKAFVDAARMPIPNTITVSQPSYATAFAKLLATAPLDTWKAYLRVRLLDDLAQALPAGFRAASFQFHDATVQGLRDDQPRWQKAVGTLNDALGEALGQVYVSKYFPPAYKARMTELVQNLLKTYSSSIDGLTWMTPPTKAAAHEKLSKYVIKIGYPDQWRDYGALEIRPHDPVGNLMRAHRFDYLRQAVRVGKPVDRTEWGMTPQTVNAYYDASKNEIVFPAAILQPPFFDMAADDAVNYGAIGAVIGHEISHGFDDEGSKFDGDGKLREWWSADDRKAFDALTAKLVAQYDGYEVLPGKHLNGQLTLGENIADLSGLQIASKAYKASLKGGTGPVIDGLTGEQRFFLGWAQVWRVKVRDERALQLLTIDQHSPGAFRANGAAVNNDAFHDAFSTKPGDGLYKAPADRLRLW